MSNIVSQLVELAETEKSVQLLASEIEKTRRRVNALEHVMIPELQENIKFITMKLDENERSTQVRLMKVKDMMLEQVIESKKLKIKLDRKNKNKEEALIKASSFLRLRRSTK